MEENKLIRIDRGKHQELKKLAKKYYLSQTDFLNAAVDYFRKTGINPTEPISSPREEIAKLTKRQDQIIAFLRKFESDKLNPLFVELTELSQNLKGQKTPPPISMETPPPSREQEEKIIFHGKKLKASVLQAVYDHEQKQKIEKYFGEFFQQLI